MEEIKRTADVTAYDKSEYAVRVKNLTKRYKIYPKSWYRIVDALTGGKRYTDFYALKDLTIDLPKGETIGILGRNGSGKSTLLKMITGVTNITKGSIEVNGRISAMLELTSGFDKELTGYENIYLKATAMGISREIIEKKVEDIVDFADIGEHISQPVKTYSSGMKSRLGFAVSINVDPDILIVDEVLAVGDEAFKIKCLAKMEEFRKAGKTILFVSHSLVTVKGFCTKSMWIKNGDLVDYGDTGPVAQKYEDYLREVKRKQRDKEIKDEKAEEAIHKKSDIIKVSGVKIIDDTVKPASKNKFEYGNPISVQFNYEVKKPIDKLICTVCVRDSEIREIYASDKRDINNKLSTEIGKHSVKITFPEPKLLPGKYLLSGEMWINDSGLFVGYANKRQFTVFSKEGEFKGTGITYMDYKIENDMHKQEESKK